MNLVLMGVKNPENLTDVICEWLPRMAMILQPVSRVAHPQQQERSILPGQCFLKEKLRRSVQITRRQWPLRRARHWRSVNYDHETDKFIIWILKLILYTDFDKVSARY